MAFCNSMILVVEDDLNDQFLIENALRKAGWQGGIRVLNHGEEAIAYMMGEGPYADRHKHPLPSFITTDLKMPVSDGFAVLEHLKKHPALAIIPTVVLSASGDQDDIRTAYQLGACSYHKKASSFVGLVKQLKVLLDYWESCELPEVDTAGMQGRADSRGKLGDRFSQAYTQDQPWDF